MVSFWELIIIKRFASEHLGEKALVWQVAPMRSSRTSHTKSTCSLIFDNQFSTTFRNAMIMGHLVLDDKMSHDILVENNKNKTDCKIIK